MKEKEEVAGSENGLRISWCVAVLCKSQGQPIQIFVSEHDSETGFGVVLYVKGSFLHDLSNGVRVWVEPRTRYKFDFSRPRNEFGYYKSGGSTFGAHFG